MTLQEQIEDAKQLLDLEFNWDEDGGLPPTQENFDAAVNFCIRLYNVVDMAYDYTIITPYINAGNDGSIDVLFETEDRKNQFLINFPNTNYFGHNLTEGKEIKAKFEGEITEELVKFFAYNLCK
jgi:hypothetical protein